MLWSDQVEEPLDSNSALNVEDHIAEGVARIMASQGGIVAQNERHQRSSHSTTGYACVLQGFAYMASQSIALHAEARDCLERTIAQDPNYVEALALLSYIYNDEGRQGYNPRGSLEDINARAMAASDRALKLGPMSSLVLQTRAGLLYQRGDFSAFEEMARKAIELNPGDPENYAFLGNRLYAMGRYEEGVALLRQALAIDPSPPAVHHGVTILDAFRLGNYRAAAKEAETLDVDPDYYLLPVILAALYGELGDKEKAAANVAKILELRPNYAATFRADVTKRHFKPDLIDHMADGLRKAGLPVP